MKEKNIFPFIAVICIFLIVITSLIVKDKRISLDSEEIKTLYSYLGEVDTYHCGGLKSYNGTEVTLNNLNKDDALCMAYHNLEENKKSREETSITNKNDSDIEVCKISDEVTIVANEDSDKCSYYTFSKDELNESYQKMYGEKIKDYINFYISSNEKCFVDGDTYYCGNAETYNYSIGSDATIYRMLNKAIKKNNGEIVIYDYFLKVMNNTCYKTASNANVDSECTENLKDNIDKDFVEKYGTLYKHTFKKDKNGNYYWFKSDMQ
ncbi:MAG: hypothetical protein NC483_06065 [Ruminococcus sp.]|nr:hypothetical protein [Ruminococcus sp.]